MPNEAHKWKSADTARFEEEWLALRKQVSNNPAGERFLQGFLKERVRRFAIETGQIEGLYTLKPGVTEQLVAEGFAAVAGTDAYESVDDEELRGLLNDQRDAFVMMSEEVKSQDGLRLLSITEWHGLLTRHQSSVAGVTHAGRRVQVPFERKGTWKRKGNITTLPDGATLEYCPPELVQSEMERLLEMYVEVERQRFPAHVEAAWLHHRFVRIHPFEDGNKRTGRLLMARCYLRRGLPPPILKAAIRDMYFLALARAHRGNLRPLARHFEQHGSLAVESAVDIAQGITEGRLYRANGNGGRTVGDRYYPPEENQPSTVEDDPKMKGETGWLH